MEKTDVFLFVENDDWSSVSASFRALKKSLKTNVDTWTIVGPKGEKLERSGYDLGAKIVVKPAEFSQLGSSLQNVGTAPGVLIWSSSALLVSELPLWNASSARLWPNAPAVALNRSRLASWNAQNWDSARALMESDVAYFPETQVKSMTFEEYEEHFRNSFHWPFSPHLIILEQKKR